MSQADALVGLTGTLTAILMASKSLFASMVFIGFASSLGRNIMRFGEYSVEHLMHCFVLALVLNNYQWIVELYAAGADDISVLLAAESEVTTERLGISAEAIALQEEEDVSWYSVDIIKMINSTCWYINLLVFAALKLLATVSFLSIALVGPIFIALSTIPTLNYLGSVFTELLKISLWPIVPQIGMALAARANLGFVDPGQSDDAGLGMAALNVAFAGIAFFSPQLINGLAHGAAISAPGAWLRGNAGNWLKLAGASIGAAGGAAAGVWSSSLSTEGVEKNPVVPLGDGGNQSDGLQRSADKGAIAA